jgi:hypothetical protein
MQVSLQFLLPIFLLPVFHSAWCQVFVQLFLYDESRPEIEVVPS